MVEFFNKPGNHTPGNEMTFRDIDHAITEGPVLVGSPQQIIDKIMYFHEAFHHDLQSFSLPTMLPHEQQLEMLEDTLRQNKQSIHLFQGGFVHVRSARSLRPYPWSSITGITESAKLRGYLNTSTYYSYRVSCTDGKALTFNTVVYPNAQLLVQQFLRAQSSDEDRPGTRSPCCTTHTCRHSRAATATLRLPGEGLQTWPR